MQLDHVAQSIENASRMVRDHWDRLGFVEGEAGAFATGHKPEKGPLHYLCRRYPALNPAEIEQAETESQRPLHPVYAEFLKIANGLRFMRIGLQGSTGGLMHRDASAKIGQPISLVYQNAFWSRPAWIPEGHFAIGAMNGPWFSQGHLYLTSAGEVELYNSHVDLIGMQWPSFEAFIEQEVSRQLTLFDERGEFVDGAQHLPGDTADWESLAEARKRQENFDRSVLGKVTNFFKRG